MNALIPGLGQQSVWSALRHLHQTEVRLDLFQDFGASLLGAAGRSFRALFQQLMPRFLFTHDRRLDVWLLSPTRLHVAWTENLKTLRESGFEVHEHQSRSSLIGSFAPSGQSGAVIWVSPGCALRKTIAVPAGIRGGRLRQSLEYLLEVETPFRRDQVYWGLQAGPKRGKAGRLIDVVAVPRSVVDPIAAELQERSIQLLEISYRDELTPDSPIRLARYPRRCEQQAKRLVAVLGLVVAMQIVAVAALPIIALMTQASHLNEATTRLSRIAGELGGLQSTLEKAIVPIREAQQELQAYPSSANVLRLLEAELGEDAVLDRLSLRGTTIQMTGSTPSVAQLTERLEKSSQVKPKSITRNGVAGASQLELFSVSLELVTAKEP